MLNNSNLSTTTETSSLDSSDSTLNSSPSVQPNLQLPNDSTIIEKSRIDLEKGLINSSELKSLDEGKRKKSGDVATTSPSEVEKTEENQEDEDGVVIDESGIPVVRSDKGTQFHSWRIVILISVGAFISACASSMIASSYPGVERDFSVSNEIATLGLSIFVLGLGFAPLILGPLSEFVGRRPVYLASFSFLIIFNFMVAFSNNIVTFLIGRFLVGCSGAAFLSVASGSVADVFRSDSVGAPMAVYTASPFLGPVFGPVISGFINQHLEWRWTWYILIIWAFGELLLLYFFVPETHLPARLVKKAKLLRKAGRLDVKAPLELNERSVAKTILLSCARPFEILVKEPMALMLDLWTAILLGILYAFFSAFGFVYSLHGFDEQSIGLSFIGIGIGIVAGTAAHPFWASYYRKVTLITGKRPPPEEHLRKALAGAVIVPASLFVFAFTVKPEIHWSISLLATIPFGVGIGWCFQGIFAFLVDAYRPVAASAMAGNSAMRSTFAAGFPLFTTAMFRNLGNQNALVLCAGLTVMMAPFPFLFFYKGASYRKVSKFTNQDQ